MAIALGGVPIVAGCGGDGESDVSAGSFCAEVRELDANFSGDNLDPSDPVSIRDALASLDPPPEVGDDVETVVASFDRRIEGGVPPGVEEQATVYDATISIESYVSDECGFDLNGFARSEPP